MPRRARQRRRRSSAWSSGVTARRSDLARQHQPLDLADRLARVEALGAGAGAVHDRVAAVELERILQIVQARAGVLVAAVDDPAVGLQQDRRAQVALAVPPVAGAGGAAAGAQDAFVQPVQAVPLL